MSMKRKAALLSAAATMFAGAISIAPADATGKPRGEETTFVVTIENLSDGFAFSQSGAFTNPDASDSPGPAFPGSSYSFATYAAPGDQLSLATMLVQTNDWFFSPLEDGIPFFDDSGNPLSGDITDQFVVLDAGTETDQPVGEGEDQAPRQAGPDTGAIDENPLVRVVPDAALPPVAELIQVTSVVGENGLFTITILNVSGASSVPGPIAPGVFVVHQDSAPMFTVGEADRGEGLEAIAEDGNPAGLAGVIEAKTGLTTPLAPGVYASARRRSVLYRPGRSDRGKGLEALAEDGNPAILAEHIASRINSDNGVFNTPVGADGPGPLLPGESYQFTVTVQPGERLQLATMLVQTNDWFVGTRRSGVRVFWRGNPIEGDITQYFRLFDAGTEVDQPNGFGPDQPLRQSAPDTGADDDVDRVRRLERDVSDSIRVTIAPVVAAS